MKEDVMGFLNEVQLNYPQAISLASGRPDELFFDLERFQEYIDLFVKHIAAVKKVSYTQVLKALGQYNRTKGIVNDLVIKYLKSDQNIAVLADDVMVTVGSQEGIMLSVMTLLNKEEDVLLTEDPSYIGLTHFALLGGYEIAPVKTGINGLCLNSLEENVLAYQKKGKKVKLVYTIPDFQNPTGSRMPIENRVRFLELAKKYNFFILEDNAYGDFVFEGNKYPTLKSLDHYKNVIYLHSFAKTIHPSLRIGVVVADGTIKYQKKVIDLMAKFKGYTTVNTPSLTQAIFGGLLLKNNFSLQEYNKAKLDNLRSKKTKVLLALESYFRNSDDFLMNKITWNFPEGGYFLTLTCPFEIAKKDVIDCAKNYRVIVTPLSFFYLEEGGKNVIRLAFSYLDESVIDMAIGRLASFIREKIKEKEVLKKTF
ncbi:MAG: PLP-dependent aminotransferase family protein [Bacteroidota bacterium]